MVVLAEEDAELVSALGLLKARYPPIPATAMTTTTTAATTAVDTPT